MIGKPIFLMAMMLALTLSVPTATAQSIEGDRFSLSLGAFITERDSDTELDGSAGNGTPINLEDDLGLNSSDTVFRIDGYVRFSKRHRVDLSVFDLSRNASKQINRDIQWGDTFYTIDTTVNTDNDLEIYKAAYTYSFLHSDDGYLGATAGLYVADARVSLSEQTLGQAEIGDITAPLPVIGLRGERKLSDRWTFRASGEFFFIEYNDIDGSLIDVYAGLDYRVLDKLSIGLGINSVKIEADATKSRFSGTWDWQYTGGLVYLKLNF